MKDLCSEAHNNQSPNASNMSYSLRSPRRCALGSVAWLLLAVLVVSHSSVEKNLPSGNHIFPALAVSAFQQSTPIGYRTSSSTGALSRSRLALADNSRSTSVDFSLSPTSDTAKRIVRENLGLTSKQYQELAKLAVLVDDWNTRVNLISRKDCSPEVVFGRHILPSLAPLALTSSLTDDNDEESACAPLELSAGQRVCDVGTGGGFPGLPLAIAFPDVEFLLVDSVGKKITAVQDMADQLGLKNVKTYHGRAESISGDFAWVTGRSVSALPSFCFWIHHLLEKKNGRLVYLIGGEIDEDILEEAIVDEEIEELLDVPGVSDKRVLVFPKPAVDFLAEVSGETLKVPKRGGAGKHGVNRKQQRGKKEAGSQQRKKKNDAKGQWAKRDSSTPKQRGYSNFKRFDSLEN
ncbi:unnamed protein product [Pseudo-nitzschia multistriata]|uniref:Ribosomal RNA small subunit methyltransferase G n=1 Tax=Pseudo-nitzschia multistriata TaxID=183589 RepID=A0A448YYS1_9STRA|nr:unnamed protein product [Pseudo-nitzschia multistriata]